MATTLALTQEAQSSHDRGAFRSKFCKTPRPGNKPVNWRQGRSDNQHYEGQQLNEKNPHYFNKDSLTKITTVISKETSPGSRVDRGGHLFKVPPTNKLSEFPQGL